MILTYLGSYGSRVSLDMDGELEGFQFVHPPIEVRFVRDGLALTEWRTCDADYHTLQRPSLSGTCGMNARGLAIETRGLCGQFILLVWRREGTFK